MKIGHLDRKMKWMFLILAILLTVYTVFLMYGDIWIVHHFSLEFLDCTFHGEIRDFYKNSIIENDTTGYPGFPATYYASIYIILGLWDLPVWLLTRFAGIDEMAVGCMLWLKLFTALFAVGCGYFVYRIMKKDGKSDVQVSFALFLFMSSLFVVIPVFHVSQVDVVALFFVLWGIDSVMDRDRITWKTILLFAVAATFKLFAIFTFAILVLLKEKRVIRAVLNMAAGLLGIVCVSLPWLGDASFQQATSDIYVSNFFSKTIATCLPGGMAAVPIFFLGAFSVLVISYALYPKDSSCFLRTYSWLNLFFYAVFFSFIQYPHPYWIVIMAPYAIFLVVGDEKRLKLNMLLETAMEVSIIFVQAYFFHFVYLTQKAFSALFLKDVPEYSNVLSLDSFGQFITDQGLDQYVAIVFALFIVCAGALLVINNPWKPVPDAAGVDEKETRLIRNGTMISRMGLIAGYFVLIALIRFFI